MASWQEVVQATASHMETTGFRVIITCADDCLSLFDIICWYFGRNVQRLIVNNTLKSQGEKHQLEVWAGVSEIDPSLGRIINALIESE